MNEAFPSRRSHTATGGCALRASNPCVVVFVCEAFRETGSEQDNEQEGIVKQRQKK